MTRTKIHDQQDAEALILGLGMYATGGGGLASRGRGYFERLFADSVEVSWTSIDEVDPETLTCSVFGMGSIAPHPPLDDEERVEFGVSDGERFQRPWIRAVDELAAHLDQEIGAIIPFELGPSNTLVALDAAARSNRVLIDGDYIGRALPKMSQALPAVLGQPTWPVSICDPWGNALILTDAASPTVAERIGKMISRVTKAVDMGASCSHAAFPAIVASAATAVIPGTLSRSLRVGQQVLAARANGTDPIAAAVSAVEGYTLFVGEVSNRTWDDTVDGYMEGTTVVDGLGEFAGATAEIWFQNEHHLVKVGGRYTAMSPDIVAIVDSDDAEPISNTELDLGRRVTVIGIKAAAPYREGAPLAITEPRHYGFDVSYVPIEKLHSDGGWG
jgi:uncharacterized protein